MSAALKAQQGSKRKSLGRFAHFRLNELARDGVAVYEAPQRKPGLFTMKAAERRAAADPLHVWRAWVCMPSGAVVFERDGQNNWRGPGRAS